MTATARIAHFTATCSSAATAAAFAAEAARTCGATDITRKGRVVRFDAVAVDSQGDNLIGDVHESARYYGGDRTKLTQTFITTTEETPVTATPTPATVRTRTIAAEKATPAKVTAQITPAASGKAAPTTLAKATPKATPAKVVPTTVKEMTREQKRAVAAVLIQAAADMLSNFGAVAAKQSAVVQEDLDGVNAKVAGELIGTWLSYCPGSAWDAALGTRPRS